MRLGLLGLGLPPTIDDSTPGGGYPVLLKEDGFGICLETGDLLLME